MEIYIRSMVDPLGVQSDESPIVAQSAASHLLQHELERYCNGQSKGCSFLIAGHRGAGKTTMVHSVIRNVQDLARGHSFKLRPLPIFLHGPSLFPLENPLASADKLGTLPSRETSLWPELPAKTDASTSPEAEIERQAQHALVQVILGLHKAVAREFADAFRSRACAGGGIEETAGDVVNSNQNSPPDAELMQNTEEWPEIAAQFEVELMEDPRAARLREFYASIGALKSGVLHRASLRTAQAVPPDQGSRELVALNGICTAHQRISGTMSARDEDRALSRTDAKSVSGWRGSEFVKPLATVLSGSVAMGGAAAGNHGLLVSAMLGLAAALGASFVFDRTSTTHIKREREVDRTFIPDLSLRTLDRVLPTLMKRIRDAGLAPVLVIDELDKMGDLSQRLETMARHLKRLMAEDVFSCFLTDRGYLEYVTHSQREKAYGTISSYFTHAVFVCYEPRDLDSYLDKLLDPRGDHAAENDRQLLKWLLRHRSQMHALDLNREILAIRKVDTTLAPGARADTVDITSEQIRLSPIYTIDITLQVAIEHELGKSEVILWLRQSPARRLTLMDALYYISREWRYDAEEVDLSDAGLETLWRKLESRMNLDEVQKPLSNDAPTQCADNEKNLEADKPVLKVADKVMLTKVVRSLAYELSRQDPSFKPESESPHNPTTSYRGVTVVQPVLDCVLHDRASVLQVIEGREHCYRFRARSSALGLSRRPPRARTTETPTVMAGASTEPPPGPQSEQQSGPDPLKTLAATAEDDITFLNTFEELLSPLFFNRSPPAASGKLYVKLAEEFGVLPINRPADQMVLAKDRVSIARTGVGTFPQLEDDIATLKAFRQMLVENHALILSVIATAAAIGHLKTDRPLHEAVNGGLDALSSGLHFRQFGVVNMQQLLTDFHLDLSKWFDDFPPKPDWSSQVPDKNPALAIKLSAEEWIARAMQARDHQDVWARIHEKAWEYFAQDLRGVGTRPSPRPFPVELVLCMANASGPAVHFKRNPFKPVVEDWTRLVIASFREAREPNKSKDIPLAVLKTALVMLGFNLVFEATVSPYLDALSESHSLSELGPWIRAAFEVQASLVDSNEMDMVAVVLKIDSRSKATDTIASASYQPLVILTPRELSDAPDEFLQLVMATGNVLLIWDGPPQSKSRDDIKQRMSKLRSDIAVDEALFRQTRYGLTNA